MFQQADGLTDEGLGPSKRPGTRGEKLAPGRPRSLTCAPLHNFARFAAPVSYYRQAARVHVAVSCKGAQARGGRQPLACLACACSVSAAHNTVSQAQGRTSREALILHMPALCDCCLSKHLTATDIVPSQSHDALAWELVCLFVPQESVLVPLVFRSFASGAVSAGDSVSAPGVHVLR